MNASLLSHFSVMQDPRSERNQHYDFHDLLSMIIIACMGGEVTYTGIASFIALHRDVLGEHFDLADGAPSHDCIREIMQSLNPNAFLEVMTKFTQAVKEVDTRLIAIDGKSIKGRKRKNPLVMVSAWCCKNKLVLGQRKVEDKSNEITAVPYLLSMLNIAGSTVTMDAMGCQRTICDLIKTAGGDYVIALKGNQSSLLEDTKAYFQNEKALADYDSWVEWDKAHGRIEKRESFVVHDVNWLQHEHRWPHLRAVGMVKLTCTKKGVTTSDVRFYIMSDRYSAEYLCNAARAHWSIENQLHWRLDVLQGQDQSLIESDIALENMDILRKISLALLQVSQDKLIKKTDTTRNMQRRVAQSASFLKQVIQLFFHA